MKFSGLEMASMRAAAANEAARIAADKRAQKEIEDRRLAMSLLVKHKVTSAKLSESERELELILDNGIVFRVVSDSYDDCASLCFYVNGIAIR